MCAFGVFMHIDRDGIEHYLSEVARVIEPDCPALLNFMALTPDDVKPKHGRRSYVPVGPGEYTNRPDREGWSLAYDDSLIREMIAGAGLALVHFERGAWHGDPPSPGAKTVPAPTSTSSRPRAGDGMTAVCVTGMHRSGTSFVAGALRFLGVSLGDPARLLKPGPDNPLGYFEIASLMQLDDEVLAHLGGAWDQPPVLDPGWSATPASSRSGNAPPRSSTTPSVRSRRSGGDRVEGPAALAPPAVLALGHAHRDDDRGGAAIRSRSWRRSGPGATPSVRPRPRACGSVTCSAAAANDPGHLLVRHTDIFDDLPATVARLADHLGLPRPGPDVEAKVRGPRHRAAPPRRGRRPAGGREPTPRPRPGGVGRRPGRSRRGPAARGRSPRSRVVAPAARR